MWFWEYLSIALYIWAYPFGLFMQAVEKITQFFTQLLG